MNIQPDRSRFAQHLTVDIEKAAKMWNDGMEARQIAARFSVTKATIVGIAFRNRDLFPRKKPMSPHGTRKAYVRSERKVSIDAPKPVGENEIEITPTEYDAERLFLAKTLMEIEAGECRFPLAGMVFCAAEVKPGSVYCCHHHSRAYRPRKAKEQA